MSVRKSIIERAMLLRFDKFLKPLKSSSATWPKRVWKDKDCSDCNDDSAWLGIAVNGLWPAWK